MTSFKLRQFISALFLLFAFGLAAPVDANGSLQPRQTVCRTGFGCLGFGVSGWNSFLLDIPAASDPHTHEATSTGRVTQASIWTKGDGGAFFWISVVEGYRPPPGQRVEVRAWVGSTRLNLNNNEIFNV
ncbi:hypothetical protein FNYG_13898 [Fusarium nygamai]|uniref:CBM1 domain-containing protein n=1 Tax=Gibberella nygamai TaxID=42673 RepID=A0A2K0UUI5_GIBNY|nr:hypothetical protein FNYG_13898 [Fusarium nygamai]